ncbi:MAG: MBL fold metallo-hydrolase, partial [Fimbriimonas ginsengisoli]|nr:MBL fold metallo-hydrolase [Fimbriimonas ginsengisoli]
TGFWLACLGLGLGAGWLWPQPAARLTFLSVGQGDCAVFQEAGATILVDVGPANPHIDAGARIVVPRLLAQGAGRVDLVFLTHPDGDHIGGLRSVLRTFPGARVAVSAAFRHSGKMRSYLAAAGVSERDVLWLISTRARVGAFQMTVDCPPVGPWDPDNDGSLFIRLSNQSSSAVLTGDASEKAEWAEAALSSWRSDVMKVGHHGSRTSSSEEWIAAVHPRVAVISCGSGNLFGHPHAAVLARLAQAGVEVHRTDLEGDLSFVATPGGFRLASR